MDKLADDENTADVLIELNSRDTKDAGSDHNQHQQSLRNAQSARQDSRYFGKSGAHGKGKEALQGWTLLGPRVRKGIRVCSLFVLLCFAIMVAAY